MKMKAPVSAGWHSGRAPEGFQEVLFLLAPYMQAKGILL